MSHYDKTKEELIIEFKELQQKYNSLKESYDTDITEGKQAEIHLKKEHVNFLKIFAAAPVGLLLVDRNTFITRANKIAADMVLRDPVELIGKLVGSGLECIHSTESSKGCGFGLNCHECPLRQGVESVLANGSSIQGAEVNITMLIGGKSQERWLKVNAEPIEIDRKQLVIVAIDDITEHKRAEESLRESEEKFRIVFEYSVEGKSMSTIDGKLKMNKAFCQILGYSEDELTPLKLKEITHPDDIANNQKIFDTILSGEKAVARWEKRYIHKKGNVVWVDISTALLRNNEGNPLYFITSINDITERKKTEQEIKLKNEQLQKLNAEKDKFFSIIAHDLRSPFSSFLGLTKIIAEELPNLTMAEVQQIAVSMENSATNLYSLLENLLQWARMQQGLIPFHPEEIQIHKIAAESIALMLEPAKNKGIDLVYDVPTDIKVVADSNMLQTVIRNLISNAVKFTPKGGKINLSAKSTGDESVEISIKDTGIGMNKDLVDKLFRLDEHTSRPGTEGEPSTGLGLLLCNEFVEKHGGKLWVESEEGKGSMFYFTIPYKIG